jgi:hypothetical protein
MPLDLENGVKERLGYKYLCGYLSYGLWDLQIHIGVSIQFVG